MPGRGDAVAGKAGEGAVKVREGRGGLRQASLRDSARVRVFNLYLELGCGGGDGLSNDATD